MYEAKFSPRGDIQLKFGEKPDRLKFAEDSIAKLRTNCPESLASGLVRVDIMQSDEGHMVVNEFESLEADHSCSSITNETELGNKLKMYYADMICSFANEILSERR